MASLILSAGMRRVDQRSISGDGAFLHGSLPTIVDFPDCMTCVKVNLSVSQNLGPV